MLYSKWHQVLLSQPAALLLCRIARVNSVNRFRHRYPVAPTLSHLPSQSLKKHCCTHARLPIPLCKTPGYKHVFVRQKGNGGVSAKLAGGTTEWHRVLAFYSTSVTIVLNKMTPPGCTTFFFFFFFYPRRENPFTRPVAIKRLWWRNNQCFLVWGEKKKQQLGTALHLKQHYRDAETGT